MTTISKDDPPQKANEQGIYEKHDLCLDLLPGQRCFRVKKYSDGSFETVFHEHVPRHRISDGRTSEVLRSLVARYSEWPGAFILRSHLNVRGHDPERYPTFNYHTSYPEPGVIRHTTGSAYAYATCEYVLSEAAFRIS